MRILKLAFLLLLPLTLFSKPAVASSIVVPNANASTVGNSPDDLDDANGFSFRFQQLIGSGQFVAVGGPILIDQFAWRAAPGTGPISVTAAMMDIYVSTSPRFPNLSGGAALLMSTTFADNVGPDNRLVYHGPISLTSPGCPAGPTPCAFDLLFNFQNPFQYNFLQGRLLLDIFVTTWNASAGSTVDDVDFGQNFGTMAGLFGFPGDAVGETIERNGTITQFRYTAVPEPATMTLMLSGLGALVARRRSRATRRQAVR